MDIDKGLKKKIKEAISVKVKDIKGVLALAEEKDIPPKIKGNFYLVECTNDEVREADFLDVLENYVLHYCLKHSEYTTVNSTNAVAIVKKAIRKFVRSEHSGELGELVLFCLLESQINAVQLLNKMQLKTNPNMHFHGADAVHFGVTGKLKTLYLGESKMQSAFSTALTNALGSVKTLFENMAEKKKFEVDLIEPHLDHAKLRGMEQEILNYLNPYKKKRDFCEVIAVFIGYSWKELAEAEKKDVKGGILKYLMEKYREEIVRFVKTVDEKVKAEQSVCSKRFLFFVVPFKNVQQIKTDFKEKLKRV